MTEDVIPFRKQKLVSVCASEERESAKIKYSHHRVEPSATRFYTFTKIPINSHNLLMLEIYPKSWSLDNDDASPCTKLNFMSLCYKPGTRVNDIRYNFDQQYDQVKVVDFTGPIGSMRLAFELLQKLKNCRSVVFLINNDNVELPDGGKDNMSNIQKHLNVESVRIFQDFSIVEKNTRDVQSAGWRVDEILEGCLCFPNLKRFEVSIFGTGSNYDKVNRFVTEHSILNERYSVEINNEKVKCKPKSSRTRSASSRSRSSTNLVKVPPTIPIDLSIVKKEMVREVKKQCLVSYGKTPLSGQVDEPALFQKSLNTTQSSMCLLEEQNTKSAQQFMSFPDISAKFLAAKIDGINGEMRTAKIPETVSAPAAAAQRRNLEKIAGYSVVSETYSNINNAQDQQKRRRPIPSPPVISNNGNKTNFKADPRLSVHRQKRCSIVDEEQKRNVFTSRSKNQSRISRRNDRACVDNSTGKQSRDHCHRSRSRSPSTGYYIMRGDSRSDGQNRARSNSIMNGYNPYDPRQQQQQRSAYNNWKGQLSNDNFKKTDDCQ